MSDRITSLCTRLLETEEPAEISPVADDLRYAIHEHIDKVRETACEILLFDRVVNSALADAARSAKEDHALSIGNLTNKANNERSSAQTHGYRMAAIGRASFQRDRPRKGVATDPPTV